MQDYATLPKAQIRTNHQWCQGLHVSRYRKLCEARGREAHDYHLAAGCANPGKVFEEDKQAGSRIKQHVCSFGKVEIKHGG